MHNPECFTDLRSKRITPGISKVMEKSTELQLKFYLETNNILPNVQSGFRSCFSSTTVRLNNSITHDIIGAADSGHMILYIPMKLPKHYHVHMSADDTQVYYFFLRTNKVENCINEELNKYFYLYTIAFK